MDEPQSTRLPVDLDKDQFILINWQGYTLNVREILMIIFSCCTWLMLTTVTADLLSLSSIFTGLLWSWVAIGGIALGCVKKQGRSLESHLTDRIVFKISNRHYIIQDKTDTSLDVADADWEDIDEPYGNW